MKLTVLEELHAAIKTAAAECEPNATSVEVASRLYADNRELVASVADQWIIEKLANLIQKRRTLARRERNPQLVLEDLFGLTHLPATIEVEPGRKVRRADATIEVFRALLRQLRRRSGVGVRDVERAIALMATYTPQNRRITWIEVLRKEAQGRNGPKRG